MQAVPEILHVSGTRSLCRPIPTAYIKMIPQRELEFHPIPVVPERFKGRRTGIHATRVKSRLESGFPVIQSIQPTDTRTYTLPWVIEQHDTIQFGIRPESTSNTYRIRGMIGPHDPSRVCLH